MSATGLDVFDKTLQSTHLWLHDIMAETGPDRQLAWHVLGAVLRTLRDRLPIPLAANLGSQLPILIRGVYYDQWDPDGKPLKLRSLEEFSEHVAKELENIRPVNVNDAIRAVFRTIGAHIAEGETRKVYDSLPHDLKAIWPLGQSPSIAPRSAAQAEKPARGRKADAQ
jgi:uncharacterized protein (DUF2267 family)